MSGRSRAFLPALAVAVLFALPLVAEIVGARLLVFRDAQITHWPWHRVAAAALDRGEVPFVNVAASGGQPLLANPNAVLLYPTFLLERVIAPESAFNLHFLLHVFWAFLGARVLARRLGMGDAAAFVAGIAFAFSGMVLSYGSAFMNSSASASWLPWCAAALVDVGRAASRGALVRAATAAGLALGLQLLAGEPALSLLTLAFGGALVLAETLGAPPGTRIRRLAAAAAGCLGAGALALALAAPLLLPLRAVFPMTYRGQHLYSERASGAAAFSASRAIEWLFPRFGGDPDLLGGGANWLRAIAMDDVVYIWCVTFGIVPLLIVGLAALRKDFWNRRSASLAAGGILALLFSFGFALPFYRLLYSVEALRKLRYPIKFYLLTTLCAALLAGLATEAMERRRTGRREQAALAALLALFAAGWWTASPGGVLDRWAGPLAASTSGDPAKFLEVFRGFVRGDALIGALATLAIALLLKRRPTRGAGWAVGFLALILSFSWGLPLFVSAPARTLARPPALLRRIQGPGRLYVSPGLPKFDLDALKADAGGGLPRMSRVARIVVEELVPLTAAPFGVRYLFENDPDGSYGFFNRVANEAANASTPSDRDRLLTLYGARWILAQDAESHPLFQARTGLEVAGRRLVLLESPRPVAELRWAGRVWRRAALSGTLELVRSDRFDPHDGVALPGGRDADPAGPAVAARLEEVQVGADRAAATITAEGDGNLVFARTFFNVWHARVDGRPVPIAVANARDLAVAVPKGLHHVEIEYDRSPFRRGVGLQAAALLLAAAVAARPRR